MTTSGGATLVHDADRPVVVRIQGPRARLRRGVAGAPPQALALALLGGFGLRVDGAEVELPIGAQRLVALLALRGRTSRSRLAGTLWPETTEHRALASLRTGIWRINQVADLLVSSTSGTVDLASRVDVDVRRLMHRALDALRGGTLGVDETCEVLEDDGELLPDWEDDWLMADRERLRQTRLHVLEAVAERLSDAGRYGLALEAALGALRVDTSRESAHRAVIRVHLAEGNVSEARRAFEHCRTVLVRDVGVEPSPATTGMLDRPGSRRPPATTPPPATPPSSGSEPLPAGRRTPRLPDGRAPGTDTMATDGWARQ